MPNLKTSDLIDKHEAEVLVCETPLALYGRRRRFHGRIATVRTFEDNVLMRQRLGEDGAGKVLVVDGGGSMRRALIGDRIVELAMKNRWEGIVLNGCLRDSVEIEAMEFGVLALGRVPRRSLKDGIGSTEVSVNFGGIDFVPGQMIYVDDDGVLVSGQDFDAR